MSGEKSTSSPRRVLFLDHTSMLGGGEIALLHLVQELDKSRYIPVVALMENGVLGAELNASGIETHVLSVDPRVISARKDSISAASLLQIKAIWKILGAARRLARLIRTTKVDIVD